jgi:hypothetical protein
MNHCLNCNFWEPPGAGSLSDYGYCNGVTPESDSACCLGADENTCLLTKEDFGCVLFEPKPHASVFSPSSPRER